MGHKIGNFNFDSPEAYENLLGTKLLKPHDLSPRFREAHDAEVGAKYGYVPSLWERIKLGVYSFASRKRRIERPIGKDEFKPWGVQDHV